MMALKDHADFYYLINYTRRWGEYRKQPPNLNWVTHFEKGKYDLAILHVDQQCDLEGLNKGQLVKQMRDTIKEIEPGLPIIWINHATPVYPDHEEYKDIDKEFKSEKLRKDILGIVGDDQMVVNSHQAARDWQKGHTIIHGMGINEWKPDTKEPRLISFITQAGIGDKYYNRSYLSEVMERLKEVHGVSLQWIGTPGHLTPKDKDKGYKEILARSLVYFNPTFASPMPRSRTEAMLSGCCIVTTPQHDAETFIENGKNGFIVPHNDAKQTSELLALLIDNYKETVKIGEAGMKTARKLFNRKRYKEDWLKYLDEIL